MGGDSHGFHASLMLHILLIHLCEDGCQSYPPSGTDVFNGHIQLKNPALGFQIDVPKIGQNSIVVAFHGQIHWLRAVLGLNYDITFY